MTDEKLNIYTTHPPVICQKCIRDIVRLVADNLGLNQLYHHCPHTDTLVHMRLEEHEGRPAIMQWILQGPVQQAEAMRIIETLGQSMDAQVSLLTGSQRVN